VGHRDDTGRDGRPKGPDRRALGIEGEARAARHLAARGYRIVDRNVRAGGVELDLVARKGGCLVFIEVKTRRSSRFGPPELAVDHAKRRRLVRGAVAWLHEHGRSAARVRFDVVACEISGGRTPGAPVRWTIRHIPDAFEAGE
jgi:putative endonuclease